jgi:hypothetical protein
MVAASNYIRTRFKKVTADLRRDTETARRIVAIDDNKIELPVFAQFRQVFYHRVAPGAAHHITQK